MTKLMKPIKKANYYILTGAMGAGKSTILHSLTLKTINEPAREILAEQRSINGEGVPERDAKLFTELLLSRTLYQYRHYESSKKPIIFDRGVADVIAYGQLFGLNCDVYERAAKYYQFNPLVFFTEAWEAIYQTDEERKMSFEQASAFGDSLKTIYTNLGYRMCVVPKLSPNERAQFITDQIIKDRGE